ncbi:MAG: DUF2207 domain-containing protein [Gammaproteobacteria bacterium]|nr:MAG: DUF2207 domain-containing protein [Gammaproteobacteria bacterium]
MTSSLFALKVAPGPTFLVIVTIALMVLVLTVFAVIMRRPTGLGRRLLDEVSGFREYMEIAEKEEMNRRNPPDKTLKLFEKSCRSRWRSAWNSSGQNGLPRFSGVSRRRTAPLIIQPGTTVPGTVVGQSRSVVIALSTDRVMSIKWDRSPTGNNSF